MITIDVIIKIISVLAILGIIAAIIYVPYFAIINFIEKIQPRYSREAKRYRRVKPQNYTHWIAYSNSYEILGCTSTDDSNTIKKRYRTLVKKYHPDFIQSKEHDESSVEFAKQKMQEINQAYGDIKKERGI